MEHDLQGMGRLPMSTGLCCWRGARVWRGPAWSLGRQMLCQLPGFGVELAIKNMEYSAMDDTKVGTV